jgi:hypothetical protein
MKRLAAGQGEILCRASTHLEKEKFHQATAESRQRLKR